MEAIVADLDTRRHGFHVAIENWQHDFNIGTIVRTANAFLAAEIHIVGNRRWNRRGAMVTDRYQHVRHHPTAAGLAAYLHSSERAPARHRQPARLAHLETMDAAAAGVLPLRPGGPGALGVGARGLRRHLLDRPVRLDPLDQRQPAAAIAMHSWVREYADLSGDDAWRCGAAAPQRVRSPPGPAAGLRATDERRPRPSSRVRGPAER